MSGGRRHEAEHCVDEGPVTIEEGSPSIDEMLQHGEDVREGGRVTSEGSEAIGRELI
jgi:hypothetical protein